VRRNIVRTALPSTGKTGLIQYYFNKIHPYR
jgi:hypothetical protein